MKVKIKSCKVFFPDYLTFGKEYEVTEILGEQVFRILSDDGNGCIVSAPECAHLNGGSWEIIEE